MKKAMYFLFLFLSVLLYSQENLPVVKPVDLLDCACSSVDNPLKGLKSFTVFVAEESEENTLFVRELEKFGTVKKINFKDSKGINFEGFGTGMRLILIKDKLDVLGEQNANISRVALLLSSSIEILKSKEQLNDSYIWATNAFSVKDKNIEATKQVVAQFLSSYRKANPDTKPIFYVYL